jgi:hypothetical protein
MEKGKRKGIGVPVTRSYLYLFLSHRHAVLSRGTQRNRRKLSECSNPLQNILFPVVSAISDQVGHFHRVTEVWQLCQVRYIQPAEFIQPPSSFGNVTTAPVGHIRPTEFTQSLSGFSTVSPLLDQIYPSPIRYIRPN